jgi:hypothetical protein
MWSESEFTSFLYEISYEKGIGTRSSPLRILLPFSKLSSKHIQCVFYSDRPSILGGGAMLLLCKTFAMDHGDIIQSIDKIERFSIVQKQLQLRVVNPLSFQVE